MKRRDQDHLLNTNILSSKTKGRQQVAGVQVWDRELAGLLHKLQSFPLPYEVSCGI